MNPYPCTATEAKRIRSKSTQAHGPHPLDGKSVAQWVKEAREGWPKAPKPKRASTPRKPFPISPTDYRRIAGSDHPLQGKSVGEWVAEARAGWPKAPSAPRDTTKAARTVVAKHGNDVTWEEV